MSARPASRKRKSLAERRRDWRLLRTGAIALLVVVLVGSVVFVLHRPEVTIATVTVADGAHVHASEVRDIALTLMQGSYAFILPRASSFLYPHTAIVHAIKRAFPAVTEVSISRTSLTALAIIVTERTPTARWCNTDRCYAMDATGVIFAPAESVSGVEYRGSMTGDPLGQTFLDGSFPALMDFVEKLATGINRPVRAVTVSSDDDVAVDLADGSIVRFVRSAIGDPLLNTMVTTFRSKNFVTDRMLDYADFRFDQKVYVKWK